MTTPKSTAARDGFDQPGSTGGGSQTPSRGRDSAYPAADDSAATSPVADALAFPADRERGTTPQAPLGTDATSPAPGVPAGLTPYYSDDLVTLYHGDCRDVLASMADESVAAVLTDPPYTERTHSKARTPDRNGVVEFGAINDAALRSLLSEAGRVSRGWVVATLDYRHAVEFDVAPPDGLRVMRLGVWVKTNPTPQLSGDRPAQGWESIAYMHRSDRRSKWNGGGAHGNHVAPIPPAEGHPTAKPLPLVAKWVRWFSSPGDVVLDPFVGSGTTLRAAKDEGRRAIGVELEERYCEIAARRLAQDTLFGGVA